MPQYHRTAFFANALVVALGGAVGSALRYALNASLDSPPDAFPLATFIENIAGAFLLGLLSLVLLHHLPRVRPVHLLLCTGLLGSFTTFSAFTFEITQLHQFERPGLALLYASLSIAVGLLAAVAGMAAAQCWIARTSPSRARRTEPRS